MFDHMFRLELPYQTFFTPTKSFLEIMAEKYSDVGILEAGCGCAHALSKIREYGVSNSVGSMENARGFDLNTRTEYDVPFGVVFHSNALECDFYHRGLQVIVCRPDHSGWVEALLDSFIYGLHEVKRFIYVGLKENILRDLSVEQYSKVSEMYQGVGEDGENMLVWNFEVSG